MASNDRKYIGTEEFNSGGLSQVDLYQILAAMPPVGSIVAYIGGYFSTSSNGTFNDVLGNSIAAVNAAVGPNWAVCDGSLINDTNSPIYNGGSRRLPNLTGDRFLMGDTSVTGQGGTNTISGDTNRSTVSWSSNTITFGSTSGTTRVNPTGLAAYHRHPMNHVHRVGTVQNSGTANNVFIIDGIDGTNPPNLVAVGRNGGDGTDTGVSTFNRGVNILWYTGGVIGDIAGGSSSTFSYESSVTGGLTPAERAVSISGGSVTLNKNVFNSNQSNTGGGSGTGHSHVISLGSGSNRPNYVTCFFIKRIK